MRWDDARCKVKMVAFLEPLTKVISQRHESVAGARGLKTELREKKRNWKTSRIGCGTASSKNEQKLRLGRDLKLLSPLCLGSLVDSQKQETGRPTKSRTFKSHVRQTPDYEKCHRHCGNSGRPTTVRHDCRDFRIPVFT